MSTAAVSPKNASSPPKRTPSPPKGASSPATGDAAQLTQAVPGTTTFQAEIEADDYSEVDSAYSDSDLESFTTSLHSSVMNYQYENGRRYHAYGQEKQYFLPNDESETDRMDLNHHVMTLMQKGALHGAPLTNPQNVLDIGTGTGIWAIEFADLYPSAQVLGNDLSPIQPKWVPPNIRFEVDDIEKEWNHTSPFDFIYARYMMGSIADWKKLFRQAYKNLQPGAYFESLEPSCIILCDDGSLPADSALLKWNKILLDGARKAGRPLEGIEEFPGFLEEAGFPAGNISHEIMKLPNSPWPKDKHLKEVGGYHMATFMEGLEGISLRLFTGLMGMTAEEVHVLLVAVRKEMRNKAIHTYFNLHRIVAQKPADAE